MQLDPHHITLLMGKLVVLAMDNGLTHRGLVMGAVNPGTLSLYSESRKASTLVDLAKVCVLVTLPNPATN